MPILLLIGTKVLCTGFASILQSCMNIYCTWISNFPKINLYGLCGFANLTKFGTKNDDNSNVYGKWCTLLLVYQ